MGKIKQISDREVLENIFLGHPVYMLKKINEESTFAEVIEAEAFVIIEPDEPEQVDCDPRQGSESENEKTGERDKLDTGTNEGEQRETEVYCIPELENALPPDVPEKYPAKKKGNRKPSVDHGRICALRRGGRSVKWIAEDCKCSEITVRKHLKQEGIK